MQFDRDFSFGQHVAAIMSLTILAVSFALVA